MLRMVHMQCAQSAHAHAHHSAHCKCMLRACTGRHERSVGTATQLSACSEYSNTEASEACRRRSAFGSGSGFGCRFGLGFGFGFGFGFGLGLGFGFRIRVRVLACEASCSSGWGEGWG